MIRVQVLVPTAAVALITVAPSLAEDPAPTDLKGAYAVNGRLHVSLFGAPDGDPITTGPGDMKPSWSKTGDMIVFFRLTKRAPRVPDWKTAICVVRADGSGFRKVTNGTQTDFNPTWTRDGTNLIVFNRRNPNTGRYAVMMTRADADLGEENVVSNPLHSTYAYTCLKDGRIFVAGTGRAGERGYSLMTPNPDEEVKYERIEFAFPLEGRIDRVSLTPSETRLCCEYQDGFGPYRYPGRTLYIADFDVEARTVSNPKAITDTNPDSKTTWLYPRWTADESAVVYHCNKSGTPQLYMYRLTDESTVCLSTNPDARYLFPCGEATPK
jgi:hypothetical protein